LGPSGGSGGETKGTKGPYGPLTNQGGDHGAMGLHAPLGTRRAQARAPTDQDTIGPMPQGVDRRQDFSGNVVPPTVPVTMFRRILDYPHPFVSAAVSPDSDAEGMRVGTDSSGEGSRDGFLDGASGGPPLGLFMPSTTASTDTDRPAYDDLSAAASPASSHVDISPCRHCHHHHHLLLLLHPRSPTPLLELTRTWRSCIPVTWPPV